MTTLALGILGLDRMSTSVGLALKRYGKTGKYQFEIAGYDTRSANEKSAQKEGAIDRIEKTPEATVRDKHIVIMNLPYEDTRNAYRKIASHLREGVVILDASPLKTPSYEWGQQYLQGDFHIVGITPMINPRYLHESDTQASVASEDYFDNATFLITPAPEALEEAIDLAYNFGQLLGSKPRFIDPHDHDNLLAQTEQLPRILGLALYYNLMRSEGWSDMQWFTNHNFGVLTRFLKDEHPDGLRDEMMGNREVLALVLDKMIATLQEMRGLLRQNDRDGLEATLVSVAQSYEEWLNTRHRNDWDKGAQLPTVPNNGFMGMMFGDKLANRLKGKK
jgi:prephenate dehydrogenase